MSRLKFKHGDVVISKDKKTIRTIKRHNGWGLYKVVENRFTIISAWDYDLIPSVDDDEIWE